MIFFFIPPWAGYHWKYAPRDLIQCSHFSTMFKLLLLFFFFSFPVQNSGACWERLSWWWHAYKTAAAHPFIYLSYHSARFHMLLEELLNDYRGQIVCRWKMKMLLCIVLGVNLSVRTETGKCNSGPVKLLCKFKPAEIYGLYDQHSWAVTRGL